MSNLTIGDVARQAGVSVSTVSRILNGKPDVAEATRQRVWQVIDKMGYSPDIQAKQLRSNSVVTQIISLHYPINRSIFDAIQNAIPILEFILGASVAVESELFMFNLITTPFTGTQLVDLFRHSKSNGMILAQVYQDDDRIAVLRDTNYPFIMIGRTGDDEGLSYIDLDFEQSVLMAIEHLIQLGHRHIALLDFPAVLRQIGYSPAVYSGKAVETARIQFNGISLLHKPVDMSNAAIKATTLEVLDNHPDVTGMVVVHGDTLAGILEAFNQRQIKPNETMEFVSIASKQQCDTIWSGMTRIDLPTEAMAYEAAQMLIRKLSSKISEPSQHLIMPQLVAGHSSYVVN